MIRHGKGLPMALDEIGRQFISMVASGKELSWQSARFLPLVPLRAARLSPSGWCCEDLDDITESLSSYGFNALLLDALEFPVTSPLLRDEAHLNQWERRLGPQVERLTRHGWWIMIVLPIQLDLGLPGKPAPEYREPPLCLQSPESRRRMLHRIETIVRALPSADAVGFVLTDWLRCSCPSCQRVPFEEEAAYLLRAYSAVMNRYARSHEMWVLPDAITWSLLQEIQSGIPPTVRVLAPVSSATPTDPALGRTELPATVEPTPIEDGFFVDLAADPSFSRFSTTEFRQIASKWEELGIPRLASAGLGDHEHWPAGLAGFFDLVWSVEGRGFNKERLLYQLLLPQDEWRRWKDWRDRNQALGEIMDHLTGRASDFLGTGSTPAPVRPLERHLAGLLARANGLFHLNGIGEKGVFPRLHLPSTLRRSAQRWWTEERLRPLFARIAGLGEESTFGPSFTREIIQIAEYLDGLLTKDPPCACLADFERSSLEDLAAGLSLTLSEQPARESGNQLSLPDLSLWQPLFPNGPEFPL
jgi:hypothetical protein